MNVQNLIARLQHVDPLMPVVLIDKHSGVFVALCDDVQIIPTPGWHVGQALLIAPSERRRELVA